MIRHIVTWKLRAEDAEEKTAAVNEMTSVLEGLVPVIDELVTLKIHRNVAYEDTNWDVVLVADFASLDDLGAYLIHPDHLAAVTIVRNLVSERSAVDFEI